MGVEFRCESPKGRRYSRALRSDAVKLLRCAGLGARELSLTIITDDSIRALNRDYRRMDQPTDVLSFSQLEERGSAPPDPFAISNTPGMPIGDVVISIDTALAQARRYRITPAKRLRTLLIHGFLHLLGYDHERSAVDARRMFARERELAAMLTRNSRSGRKRAAR